MLERFHQPLGEAAPIRFLSWNRKLLKYHGFFDSAAWQAHCCWPRRLCLTAGLPVQSVGLGPVLPTARRSPRELNWVASAEIIGSGRSAEKPASRFKARSTSDIIFPET